MTTHNTQTAMFDIQSLFNPKGSQELFKTMASMNERMTAIFVEAGTRSVEIMTATTKQSLSNLSEVAQVREALRFSRRGPPRRGLLFLLSRLVEGRRERTGNPRDRFCQGFIQVTRGDGFCQ